MPKNSLRLFAMVVTILVVSPFTFAAVFHYSFTGTVQFADGLLPSGIDSGVQITGSFLYDANAQPYATLPRLGLAYFNMPGVLTIQGDEGPYSFPFVIALNQASDPSTDYFKIWANNNPLSGYDFFDIDTYVTPYNPNDYTELMSPLPLTVGARFYYQRQQWPTGAVIGSFSGVIENIGPTRTMPEPSTCSLSVGAVGLIALLCRCKKSILLSFAV